MSSSRQKLAEIPVKAIGAGAQPTAFHWKRRAVQALAIALAVLVPASGLLRIDPEAGAFVVIDRQVWFSDFFLMFGLWITLASGLVLLYSSAGTVFCGWACPQNTLAEWANNLTRKLLGKRAELSMSGDAPRVAAAKNKILNWMLLGLAILAAAMFFGLIPLFWFYPPAMVWHFMTLQHDQNLARSLYWIYTVCVLILFVDIAVIRHFWCRFACIYKVWQHSFKTKQTLHVTYDASRADECAKCNYCVTTCFISLDPRKTDIYDSCINCGECIDACNRLHEKQGAGGLLRFEMGERTGRGAGGLRNATVSLLARAKWATAFTAFGLALFAWGLWSYDPYHIAVDHADVQQSGIIQDYRIAVTSKLYRPSELNVQVQGLPAGSYRLSAENIKLGSAGRGSITLAVDKKLKRGVYGVVITVSALDGWTGRFRIQHFSEQGQ
ncbi:MAG TPA: 4Fe-4S dicluster domain-containing protein [Gallionellaceae bacterium]